MAISSDGTQAFGIESSPVTINSVTYVAEGLTFNYEGERKDIMDSNGMVLVMSLWDDHYAQMSWLDATDPVGGTAPGDARGQSRWNS